MADKMKDAEIADELKRFGETIKLPIDRKRRPILIKKLNHYYAKENPPPKKSTSSRRRTKPAVAPEFSDDSQDENETGASNDVTAAGRRGRASPQVATNSTRSLRNRRSDNGRPAATGRNSTESGRKKQGNYSAVQLEEVYPREFSDNDDTADESVYEVEEQSIGVNTSMNLNETNDDLPSTSFSTQSRNISSIQLSPRQSTRQSSNSGRNNHGGLRKKDKQKQSANSPDSEHLVSKTILMAVLVFFIALASCYVYIRRDIFIPRQAALDKTDLNERRFCDDQQKCYDKTEVDLALEVLKSVYNDLAARKGKHELGEVEEEDKRLGRPAVLQIIQKMKPSISGAKLEELADLCFKLIIKNGSDWDILAFTSSGTTASDHAEVAQLESKYGDLAFLDRLWLAAGTVMKGLALVCIIVCICVLGVFCIKWQHKRKEKLQERVYDLVEKIIEILQENAEKSEKKKDERKYPPYMAVQHIRDILIPVSKRKAQQWLWDEAVRFIESNESRIRVETQMIEGEEFTVWRWLQAVPNGHKVWQGQAFGETSQNSNNCLPYGPTPCLKVRYMFDASKEKGTDDWHLDVEESILEKCRNNNGILHVFVDRSSNEGCVYMKCTSCEKAYQAYQALHGWWFDGRLVTVKYLRLEHYHDRFPDSRNKRHPLSPSNEQPQSLSRPYHKSALEMT